MFIPLLVVLLIIYIVWSPLDFDTIRVQHNTAISLAEIQLLDAKENIIPLVGVASQSSTAYGGVAARAVDGHVNGYWPNGSVTHTEGSANDWWQFKLAQPHVIGHGDRLRVWNRTDCCGERLASAKIQLLKRGRIVWEETLLNKVMQDFVLREFSMIANPMFNGINIEQTNGLISVAEIQLKENDRIIPFNTVGGITASATQSSVAVGGVASRAIDGNTDGNWNNGSVTHTNEAPINWLKISLGQQLSVSKKYKITIYNRTDCCGEKLAGAYLRLYSGPVMVWSRKLTAASIQEYTLG